MIDAKKLVFLVGVFFSCLLYHAVSRADTRLPQNSYAITSANNQYLLVMLGPNPDVDQTMVPPERRTESHPSLG